MKTSFTKLLTTAQAAMQQDSAPARRRLKHQNALLVSTFIIILTSLASADIYHDLTTTLYYGSCRLQGECNASTGAAGSPAFGSADFTDMPPNYPPWSFSFQTGSAFQWSYNQWNGDYGAAFNSGTFNMNGPYGLTFSGNIDMASATVEGGDGFAEVDINFSGHWNNGVYAYGQAFIQEQGPSGDAYLQTTAVAPEPSSLIVFGSGILGVAGMLRRRSIG